MAIVLDIVRSNPHGKIMQLFSLIIALWIGVSDSWAHIEMGLNSLD